MSKSKRETIRQGDVVQVADGPLMIVSTIDDGMATVVWTTAKGSVAQISVPVQALTFRRRFLPEDAAQTLRAAHHIEMALLTGLINLLAGRMFLSSEGAEGLNEFVISGVA